MEEETKRRERKDMEEEDGLEEASEQDEVFSPPEKTLTEEPGAQGLDMPSFPPSFSPTSISASTISPVTSLPSANSCQVNYRSKRNETRKLSLLISEVAHNTLSTLSELLVTIRSITLKNQIHPSEDEGSKNEKILLGKIDDFHDENGFEHGRFKETINLMVMNIIFRILIVILIFVHLAVLITALCLTPQNTKMPLPYCITFLLFGLFFLADVLFQVFLEGVKTYFSSVINALDLLAIVLFLALDVTYVWFDIEGIYQIPKLIFPIKALRLSVLLKLFQLINAKRKIEKAARKLVSENKRRYRKDGFDLDLTYVTDNVIAMSFPSSGSQSLYRNSIKEVARFLDLKHPDHYKIYNLCSERTYNHSYFHYRVERFPIEDHNVPTLIDMLKFVDSVFEWMEKDSRNVIVVHCMGGKGRTGTMICIWLIASECFDTPEDSLEHFGQRRTDTASSSKFQGVETPSQSRYVQYFAQIKNRYHWTISSVKTLRIKSITIYSIRGVGKGNGKDMKITVKMNKKIVYTCLCSSVKCCQVSYNDATNSVNIILNNSPEICGDVKVTFSSPALPKLYEKCAFFFWFNTSFIEQNRLYLSRNELDNPHKQKTWNIYREDFAVELLFEDV